jgi:two-component system sensor histidine kinase ChvG
MLKDEVALSKEKMKKINIEPIIQSVVDDYNNIQKLKKILKFTTKMMVMKNILLMVSKTELSK